MRLLPLNRPAAARIAALLAVLLIGLLTAPADLRAQDTKAALRLQILVDEQRTEQQRLEDARRRHVDRSQARDTVGIREAEAAIARHEQNLKALAAELGPAERAAQAAPKASPATVNPPQTPKVATPAVQPARWWDVYDRAAAPLGPASADVSPTRPLSEPFQPTARRLP